MRTVRWTQSPQGTPRERPSLAKVRTNPHTISHTNYLMHQNQQQSTNPFISLHLIFDFHAYGCVIIYQPPWLMVPENPSWWKKFSLILLRNPRFESKSSTLPFATPILAHGEGRYEQINQHIYFSILISMHMISFDSLKPYNMFVLFFVLPLRLLLLLLSSKERVSACLPSYIGPWSIGVRQDIN